MECGIFHTTYQQDMAFRHTWTEKARLALLLGFLLIFPFVASRYWLTLANQIGLAVIGAIGLNILTGFTGQISLGQGAFMAVGAYGAGILANRLGWPIWLTIPAASLLTAGVGAIFGIPSLRLKGLYLAIATLAAQQIIDWLITHWTSLTGGVEALVLRREANVVLGVALRGDRTFYWIIMAFAAATTLFTANLFRTRVGRAFVAIRDHDIAAEVIGINLFLYKLLAFATSSFFVGLTGALTAHYRGIISWERFTIETSILYLAMIIIGGLGSVSGSIYGAAFMVLVPAFITNVGRQFQTTIPAMAQLLPFIQQGIFGIVIIFFLVIEPEGLAKIWRDIKSYFALWPFSY
ncbi:MAG: branched-chain amino acid ABC transporter permease [Chloroflexi bacterium]|nr:MAG: branched-chain amino acid ABC transporter permease [Chloroflexota bacterium]